MARHGVTDEQWALIADLFPLPKATGRPPMPMRRVFDAICWICRSGAPWRDLPEELGPWETVYGHFNRWTSAGLLHSIFAEVKRRFSVAGLFDHELWSIDGSIMRAHRCATGGGKKVTRRSRPIMPSAVLAAGSRRKHTSPVMAAATR